MRDNSTHPLLRFLYTQNPFYIISAGLILYGIQAAFAMHAEDPTAIVWLAASLYGYAALTALVAVGVIRIGQVWNDARSLLVVLLSLLFALAILFDRLWNLAPWQALYLAVGGCAFSVILCEIVIRQIGMRLPLGYRLPFYLLLALVYGYPATVAPRLWDLPPDEISDRIAAFPVIAALGILTLIPAVRKGSRLFDKNGTPWSWPLLPWTMFAFVALGLALRFLSISIAFSAEPAWESPFGLYHMTPLGLATMVLLYEIGVVERLRRVRQLAFALSPAIVYLSIPATIGSFAYMETVQQLTDTLASPTWLAMVALAGFFATTMYRGDRAGEYGVTTSLLGLAMIAPSDAIPEFNPAWALPPLSLLTGILALKFILQPGTLRYVLTFSFSGLTYALCLPNQFHILTSPQELALALTLSIVTGGFLFEDTLARHLRALTFHATAWLGGALAFYLAVRQPAFDWILVTAHGVVMAAAVGHWQRFRELRWLKLASIYLLNVAITVALLEYHVLQRSAGTRAATAISFSLAFFVAGLAVSAIKCGALPRLRSMSKYLLNSSK